MFQYELLSRNKYPVSPYARQTYDATWSIGLVLSRAAERWRKKNSSISLENFDYTRYDMAKEFLSQFSQLNILGVSGPMLFNGADRIGISAFYQIQNGIMQPIVLYDPVEKQLDFHCPECVAPKWSKYGIPFARRILKLRIVTISPLAFFVISVFSALGILVAITYLIFNTRFKKLKYVNEI